MHEIVSVCMYILTVVLIDNTSSISCLGFRCVRSTWRNSRAVAVALEFSKMLPDASSQKTVGTSAHLYDKDRIALCCLAGVSLSFEGSRKRFFIVPG